MSVAIRTGMSRLIFALFVACASFGSGCALSTEEETDAEQPSEPAAPVAEEKRPNPPIAPYHPPEPPDPCETGMPTEMLGRTVWIPVPCNKHWIDKGDPPPERLRR